MQRCPIMNVFRPSSLLLCLVFGCAAATQPSETPAADAPPADHASHQAGPVGTELVRDVTESPEKYEIGEADWEAIRSSWMVRQSGLPLARAARSSSRAALHWRPSRSHSLSRVYWRLPVTRPAALRFRPPLRLLPSNPIHCPQVAPPSRRRRILTGAPPSKPSKGDAAHRSNLYCLVVACTALPFARGDAPWARSSLPDGSCLSGCGRSSTAVR
jgi:hypothetical protein